MDSANESIAIVYSTFPNEKSAKLIADNLIKSRLAACCNIISGVKSIYRWEDKIEEDPEIIMLIKIRAENFDLVEKSIAKSHPYSVPCILCIPIEGAYKAFQSWLIKETLEPDQNK